MERIAHCCRFSNKGMKMTLKEMNHDTRGFTLIEMMVALLILSVSILALTSVTLTAIKTNMNNDLRNTSIRLTTEAANDLFDLSFDALDSSMANQIHNVAVRGGSKEFTVSWVVTSQTSSLKQIVVTVQYETKGITRNNRAIFYRPKTV